MRAVIVLFAVFVQVINIALCDDAQPQFMVVPQQFFLPACFPKPGGGLPQPPGQPPVPPPPPQPPRPCNGQSPPPEPQPPKTGPCSCCNPPTGALALLLDIIAELLNLPKGSLSKLPLCCAKDVPLPQLVALTAPLSSVAPNAQSPKKPSLSEIEALIGLLKTPQALAQTMNIAPNLHFIQNQIPNAPPKIPNFPPLNSNIPPPDFPPPNFHPQFPPQFPIYPSPPQCVNRLEPNIVVDESIGNVPVYQNTIRHEEERTVRNVPVIEKHLENQEEHIVRQVPIVRRITRPVVETRTRHVPVIRKRIRTVVEPYTSHVPILEKFTRPVEEMFITSVPILEKRSRPVFMQTVRQVPVTENRLRPVVHSQITRVPVKQQVVKHFVEHRVKPYVGPCEHLHPPPCFPFPPTFLNVPVTPSFPSCKR